MKQKNYPSILAALYILISLCLVACGDNSRQEEIIHVPTTKAGQLELIFQPTTDQLALFDITVTYTDANGTQQTEPITANWHKTIHINLDQMPFTEKWQVKQTLKENVSFSKTLYQVGATTSYALTTIYSNNQPSQGKHYSTNSIMTIGANQVANYAERMQKPVNTTLVITPNEAKNELIMTEIPPQ